MTISDFLLARIAEWEAIVSDPRYVWSLDWPEIGDPEKVLAACKAMRSAIELHAINDLKPSRFELDCHACDDPYPCDTLRALASAYAHHSDYRKEWA